MDLLQRFSNVHVPLVNWVLALAILHYKDGLLLFTLWVWTLHARSHSEVCKIRILTSSPYIGSSDTFRESHPLNRKTYSRNQTNKIMHGPMASPFQQLLSLLLVLLPSPLREHLLTSHVAVDEFHPIFLVPGVSCSDLEARLTEAYRLSVPRCGAMKGKGWFGLWKNISELLAHDYVQCFQEADEPDLR